MRDSDAGRDPAFPRQRNTHSICRKVISIFCLFLMLTIGPIGLSCKEARALSSVTTEDSTSPVVVSTKGLEIIILSSYKETLKIGQRYVLVAVSTGGIEVSFKSSDSSIASVDMYGVITAKKAGTCRITAKSKGAEAACTIIVEKTRITLNTKKLSIENGASFQMKATTSSGNPVTWSSSKKSVAIISEGGLIEAIKPGTSVISATADGSKETCILTVMKPSVKLSADTISLYRNQTSVIKATVTSNKAVTWSSSKPSVAIVDEYGRITAIKHGEARISAKVDGVCTYCRVVVNPPVIKLGKSSITLMRGETYTLPVYVSSGNTPTFTTGSKRVATVSAGGVIRAKAEGSCTIYVREDGATAKCKVKVKENKK